jgi:hypothetical protein
VLDVKRPTDLFAHPYARKKTTNACPSEENADPGPGKNMLSITGLLLARR